MVTLTCRISERLNGELEALARTRRVSKSAIIRKALERCVRQDRTSSTASAYDLVKPLCGCLKGPRDLASNPRHLDNFGR